MIVFRVLITNIFESLFPGKPQFSLATFNLIYNTLYTLLLLAFIDPLVNLVTSLIKDKEQKLEEVSYIDERFLKTPAVAVEQALKELYDMGALARDNINRAFHALINEDLSESKKIADVEYRIDYLTDTLTNFFIKISTATKFAGDDKLIAGLHHVTNDIERLGDYAVLMTKEANYMKENNIKYLDQTKEELNQIYAKLSEMFDLGFDAFTNRRTENFRRISNLHREIKKLISSSRNEHVARLSAGVYPVEVSKSVYSVLFSLQRISDHMVNVAFSIKSTTGSKTEALQAIANEKRKKEGTNRKSSSGTNVNNSED